MSSGVILVLAMLLLGAVIATVGDRIGTKVGKARLSLFNLRPRRTATLVTILTGIVIAASTLGILFATSAPLRTGVFELNDIQRRLRRTRAELQTAKGQKDQIEQELGKAKTDQTVAQKQLSTTEKQLSDTNNSLKGVIAERDKANAVRTQAQAELLRSQEQLAGVSGQVLKLRSDISQLQTERSRVIASSEEEIRAKNIVIQERERRLQQLEAQQEFLGQEIAKLERESKGLRVGNVAIQRGQVLASATIRVVNPAAAPQAVDQLLREANRVAIQQVRPGIGQRDQILLITKAQVEQLINQIDDGKEYVVRILSAANYLIDESAIQVVAEAVPNQVVFKQDTVLASTSLDPSTMSNTEIQQRINLLLAASSFRARRSGLLTDSVQIGQVQDLLAFIQQLKEYKQMVELRSVAAKDIFTAGPLEVALVAADNGKVLLRSQK